MPRPNQARIQILVQRWKVFQWRFMENLKHECKALLAIILIKTHYITCIQVITRTYTKKEAPKLQNTFQKNFKQRAKL